jgi:cell division septum initiation protein DivIVA
MPDVQGKLDEIITMVETAKGKALSGSQAVIDRQALLSALEELRQLLPAEMSQARSLLRERSAVQEDARAQADEMLSRARAEADRLISAAHQERSRLVSDSELVDEAERVAAEITSEAAAEAHRMRDQTDDYIDASLARFEQLLSASLETVTRGRARVAASRAEAEADVQQYAEEYGDDQYYGGEQLSWTGSDAAPAGDAAGDGEQDLAGGAAHDAMAGGAGPESERQGTAPASTA